MKYSGHFAGTPADPSSFTIVVDDETNTWTTIPPGMTIQEPVGPTYFSAGGAIGSGKTFVCLPDGTAEDRS